MTPSLLDAPETSIEESPDTDLSTQATPAPPDWGKNNRDAPDCIKNAFLAAIRDAQSAEKYVRRQEILQDANHRFYDMGIQHIYQGKDYCFIQASPGGTYYGANGKEAFGEYIEDYDIFHPFALIQQAKLSENMPGIDFQAVDPNEPDDTEAANAADGMRREFDRNNDVKQYQKEIIYHLQMGGRVVQWTRTDDMPEKFGDSKTGKPRRTGRSTYYGVIESKVPLFANSQREFWYTILYDDPDIKMAKTDYPWIADKISAGQQCLDENAYERIARLGVIQGSQGSRYGFRIGDSISHLISRGNIWLRLSAFEAVNEEYVDQDGAPEQIEDEDGPRNIKIKEKIAQVYPEGVHVCVIGDQYAESFNASMDDCLGVATAFIGKGQSRMPIMKSMVVVQDRFNSSMNYIAENFDYGAPSIWMSCQPAEFAAIKKQHSTPWAFRNMKQLPQGITSVAAAIYREPPPEIPASFTEYMEFLMSKLPQFQLSLPPSAWGAGMTDQRTAAGYQLAVAQAMGIQGIFWQILSSMAATMYYHNCLAIMKDENYPEQIAIPGQGGKNIVVRKESLTKGNFRAFPDTESGFPESTAAKRGTLERVATMLADSPLAAQIYGSPDNVAYMLREEGLGSDLVIPEAEARNKQLREIETLLAGSPIVNEMVAQALAGGADVPTLAMLIQSLQQQGAAMQQAAMQAHAAMGLAAQAMGQPTPPLPPPFDPSTVAKSSVTVWKSDYHVWEAKKCRDWMSGEECNTELSIGRADETGQVKPNVAGVLNLFLHWMEHEAAALLEAPPISGPLPTPNMKPQGPPAGGVTPAVGAPAAPAAG